MAPEGSRYLRLISSQQRGPVADLLRALLAAAALPYRCGIALRNFHYRISPRSVQHVGPPVVSVGNLTVGGTGKTPVAARIARLLADRGRRVAILSRGYKRAAIQVDDERQEEAIAAWSEASDEARVLRRRCPRAIVVLDPDRVAGARRAISAGADCLVLDDGFQHRRIGRDLDIVLVDATLPFGHGRLLPRGLLREPVRSLRRADLIILTRSDEVHDAERHELVRCLGRISGGRPVIEAVQRITGFSDVKGRPVPVDEPAAMQAVIFAGIGNFGSFRRCVERMGVRVLAAYQYPDHHYYTDAEIAGVCDAAAGLEANAILTTEKDAVKLVGRWQETACPLLVLNLEIEFCGGGDTILAQALDRALAVPVNRQPLDHPHGQPLRTG